MELALSISQYIFGIFNQLFCNAKIIAPQLKHASSVQFSNFWDFEITGI